MSDQAGLDSSQPGRAEMIAICAQLPEVEIGSRTGQHVSFSVRGKKFAYHLVDHHGDWRISFSCKAPRGAMEALVAADPERYYRPAYMAQHGWVGYYLDTVEPDWDQVRAMLLEAYVLMAPKKLAAQIALQL